MLSELVNIIERVEISWDPIWACLTLADVRIAVTAEIDKAVQQPSSAASYVRRAAGGLKRRYDAALTGREEADWACEIAFCYQQALSRPGLIRSQDDNFEWLQRVGYWLDQAIEADKNYTIQQFRVAVKELPGLTGTLQRTEQGQALLADLQGKSTAKIKRDRPQNLYLSELTRVRQSAGTTGGIGGKTAQTGNLDPNDYDPDYWLSHTYHRDFALRFGDKMPRRAAEAWRTAAWLYPRYRYRRNGYEALLRCAKQHVHGQNCLSQAGPALAALLVEFPERANDIAELQKQLKDLETRRKPTEDQGSPECIGCAFRSRPFGQYS